MLRLSFSTLADYWCCPRLYHYRHELELPVPLRDRAARREGSRVHELLHLHALGHTPLLGPEDDALWQSYLTAVAPYQGAECRSEWGCQVPFTGPLEQMIWLQGRMDRLYLQGETLTLLDFKTGQGEPGPLIELQLDFYAWLLWQAQSVLTDRPLEAIVARAIWLSQPGLLLERRLDASNLAEVAAGFEILIEQLLSAGRHDVPQPRSAQGKPWCNMCEYQRLCPEGSYYA